MNDQLRRLLVATTCAATVYSAAAYADYETDLLLFPFGEASYLSGVSAESIHDSNDNDYALNIFGAAENGEFVFLGEALIAKDEQEIERLQVGRRFGGGKAWLGRFHNPIGYWNTQFHHGAYLQNSASRPAIVEYEDDYGILPMHLTGLLVEGVKEDDGHGLGYAFALALGPELSDGLEPLDVLEPTSGSQGVALTLNLFRQPDVHEPTQFGLFANYTEIPAEERGYDEIRQTIAGGYGNWESDPWRVLGSAFYVRNRLDRGEVTDSEEFVFAYLQAERRLDDNWTIVGRIETGTGDENDAYLALFPDHVEDKILGAVRLNVWERHAVTLEISNVHAREDRYREFTLQWAAVF